VRVRVRVRVRGTGTGTGRDRVRVRVRGRGRGRANLDGGARGVERVGDTVLLLAHLRLRGAAHLDDVRGRG